MSQTLASSRCFRASRCIAHDGTPTPPHPHTTLTSRHTAPPLRPHNPAYPNSVTPRPTPPSHHNSAAPLPRRRTSPRTPSPATVPSGAALPPSMFAVRTAPAKAREGGGGRSSAGEGRDGINTWLRARGGRGLVPPRSASRGSPSAACLPGGCVDSQRSVNASLPAAPSSIRVHCHELHSHHSSAW